MEASPDDPHWLDETQFVYELSEQPNAIIEGVIANCRPESPSGFEAYIESVQHPKLVGFRRILHTMPDDLSQSDHFAANIRLLEKYNLTFDLCFRADQLPIARALAQKCPDVQFILDHCGVPDIANSETDPWRDHIAQIAALPNVACKISGVLAYCAEGNATTEAVRPYVEHCIASFGWNRVVWGQRLARLQHAIRYSNLGANIARNRRQRRRGGSGKTLSQKRGTHLSQKIMSKRPPAKQVAV